MTFEHAFVLEMNQLASINGKVYPIFAIEKTDTPFVTYHKSGLNYTMAMGGMMSNINGSYTIDVMHHDYDELQLLFKSIKDKIVSFLGRAIGTSGPTINSVNIVNINDMYEYELQCFRINFDLEIKYKEE